MAHRVRGTRTMHVFDWQAIELNCWPVLPFRDDCASEVFAASGHEIRDHDGTLVATLACDVRCGDLVSIEQFKLPDGTKPDPLEYCPDPVHEFVNWRRTLASLT